MRDEDLRDNLDYNLTFICCEHSSESLLKSNTYVELLVMARQLLKETPLILITSKLEAGMLYLHH